LSLLAEEIQGRLDLLRATYRTDKGFRRDVDNAHRREALAATTRTMAIVRQLAATFFPDHRRTIKPNDAIDFLHTAIPITYCDVVLVDGDALDRAERVRRKLAGKGITIATVFSGRGNGVSRFLAHLERQKARPRPR